MPIYDAKGLELASDGCVATSGMPVAHPLIVSLVYHVAVAKGTDVDHPRNLTKSGTAE